MVKVVRGDSPARRKGIFRIPGPSKLPGRYGGGAMQRDSRANLIYYTFWQWEYTRRNNQYRDDFQKGKKGELTQSDFEEKYKWSEDPFSSKWISSSELIECVLKGDFKYDEHVRVIGAATDAVQTAIVIDDQLYSIWRAKRQTKNWARDLWEVDLSQPLELIQKEVAVLYYQTVLCHRIAIFPEESPPASIEEGLLNASVDLEMHRNRIKKGVLQKISPQDSDERRAMGLWLWDFQ